MKKIMMLIVAAAAITFAACGTGEKGNAETDVNNTEIVNENDSTVKAAEDSTEVKAPEAKEGEEAKAPEAKKEETEKAK